MVVTGIIENVPILENLELSTKRLISRATALAFFRISATKVKEVINPLSMDIPPQEMKI
jgi:hypothetical protein